MAAEGANQLVNVVAFLGAAIVVVPIFKKLGLGSVLGYLAAGLAIGPFGLGLFSDSDGIIHIAELGVVMFLFLVGLEMQPKQLWSLRRYIFGIGSLQVLGAGALLMVVCVLFGASWPFAFVSAAGFVLTSTAIVMQMLNERGDLSSDGSRRIISILLFEDLMIVPLLAVVAFLAPQHAAENTESISIWQQLLTTLGPIAVLLVAGIWLLNPLFRLLAKTGIRELMTAAALFVVIGSALLIEATGLSMAMGAFLAGILLSNSSFRHQLEVDIEPFKGLLLGLFFLGVGMSLNITYVLDNWLMILSGVLALKLAKGAMVYAVARLTGSDDASALDRAFLMSHGGEFAFVLLASAAAQGAINESVHAGMNAIIVLSMVLTSPFMMIYQKWIAPKFKHTEQRANEQIDEQNNIILVGLGRYGQIISNILLAAGHKPTIIDKDIEMIEGLKKIGIKGYFGDGSHPDLLHTAGIQSADLLIVAIDDVEKANLIVSQAAKANPSLQIIARAYDRRHFYQLVNAGADEVVRETFGSAVDSAKLALGKLGTTPEKVQHIGELFTKMDNEKVHRMAEIYDPSVAKFKNEEAMNIAKETQQQMTQLVQKILADEQ